MPEPTPSPPAGAAVDALVGDRRARVRRVIAARLWWEALAAVLLAGGGALALDWTFEPGAKLRGVALAVVVVLGLATLGRAAWRRLGKPVTDRDVVTLLHRRAPREATLIATSLDLRRSPAGGANPLIEATLAAADDAAARLAGIEVVTSPESWRVVWLARGALALAAGLALWRPDLAATGVRRLALADDSWPRRVTLAPEGFTYDPAADLWRRVAARGEPTEIAVVARVSPGESPPTTLWAHGGAAGRRRERSTFTRVGDAEPGDGAAQRFRRRIERLDDDLAYAVRAGDATLRLRVIASPRPALTDIVVRSEPPTYLGLRADETPLASLSAVPEGSRVTLRARSTRPLVSASARLGKEGALGAAKAELAEAGRVVLVALPPLDGRVAVTIGGSDIDGLAATPLDVAIEVAADEPPTARLRSLGVGRAITRDALLPVEATVADDHGLSAVRFELRRGEELRACAVTPPRGLGGGARGDFDLVSLRADSPPFAVAPGDLLRLSVIAGDAYDLGPRAPTRSAELVLEVVTPSELLAQVADAQRELAAAVAGSLAEIERLEYEVDLDRRRVAGAAEPRPAEDSRRWVAERGLDLRKAGDGVRLAAARAEALRRRVIDNRLEQPELADRLGRRVAKPLEAAALDALPSAAAALGAAEGEVARPLDHRAALAALGDAKAGVARALATLGTQDSYNEVVAQLRALIREQQRVNEKTLRQETQSVRSLLE